MEFKVTLGEQLTAKAHPMITSDTEEAMGASNKQTFNFFYLLQKIIRNDSDKIAYTDDLEKRTYVGPDGVLVAYKDYGVILMDYITGGLIDVDHLMYGMSMLPTDNLLGISVYRREIWYNFDPFTKNYANALDLTYDGEPTYHLVAKNIIAGGLVDYNVGNNRYYEYLYRFEYKTLDGEGQTQNFKEILQPIEIAWNGWTLSDLHEVYGSNGKSYTTSLNDTWRFKFNISPGQQTQNLSRVEQDTLGKYPRFSQGVKNAISGSVQCLLGRDILPARYTTAIYKPVIYNGDDIAWSANKIYNIGDRVLRDQYYYESLRSNNEGNDPLDHPDYWQKGSKFGYERRWEREAINIDGKEVPIVGPTRNLGGYQERMLQSVRDAYNKATSNLSLDLLDKWRSFCYSGNPKLLRDAKGQRFIVQLTDTSNTTQETWNMRPEEISFNWVEIADANDITIVEEINQ